MIIHTGGDTQPVSGSNPLPVRIGLETTNSFSQTLNTNNATTAVLIKAATASKVIRITDLVISSQAANTISLQDTSGTVVFPRMYFPATSILSKSFLTPLVLASGKGLMLLSTAAANISVYIAGEVI